MGMLDQERRIQELEKVIEELKRQQQPLRAVADPPVPVQSAEPKKPHWVKGNAQVRVH